jgi:hypothetical protein
MMAGVDMLHVPYRGLCAFHGFPSSSIRFT